MNATSAIVLESPLKPASSAQEKLPRSIYWAVVGLACLPIGLLWDISHHVTIGRDSFWTPAHIIIQLGGIVPALLFAAIALKTTLRGTEAERNASVSFWGLRAPIGVWVTAWGCLAMLTSAPFDDWWHNRYGLDVKIVSPPHAILGLGMFGVGMGVLLFVFSAQNRANVANQIRSGWICAVAVGVMIAMWADFTTEYSWPNLQHGSKFYRVVSLPFPLLLLLAARASKVRAGATIAAATYMLIYIFMILVLPLFPAQPKLAPVYHPVTHMVPPAFPLLLIIPAIAIDLIHWWFSRRTFGFRKERVRDNPQPPEEGGKGRLRDKTPPPEDKTQPPGEKMQGKPRWWRDWLLAMIFAAVFLGLVLVVQWHFSIFLLSDAADNRFFARDGHWPYFAQPGDWMNSFWERDNDPLSGKGIALAYLRAFLSARVGLWIGNYLLRLKR